MPTLQRNIIKLTKLSHIMYAQPALYIHPKR